MFRRADAGSPSGGSAWGVSHALAIRRQAWQSSMSILCTVVCHSGESWKISTRRLTTQPQAHAKHVRNTLTAKRTRQPTICNTNIIYHISFIIHHISYSHIYIFIFTYAGPKVRRTLCCSLATNLSTTLFPCRLLHQSSARSNYNYSIITSSLRDGTSSAIVLLAPCTPHTPFSASSGCDETLIT